MASKFLNAIVYRTFDDTKWRVIGVSSETVELIPYEYGAHQKRVRLTIDKAVFRDKDSFLVITPGTEVKNEIPNDERQ